MINKYMGRQTDRQIIKMNKNIQSSSLVPVPIPYYPSESTPFSGTFFFYIF